MTVQQGQNNQSYGTLRGIWNANDLLLDQNKANITDVLSKTNTITYTPTATYHPSTKGYVDNAFVTFKGIYDPNNVALDSFDRGNHTGVQAGTTITQDTDHRFVSDTEKALWSAKEDAIGTKGTAFNKAFGVIAGSVSEGDHSHTKSELGLSNVDNTSDLNKPISTAQQTEIDTKLDILGNEKINFDAVTPPSYEAGTLFYDEDFECLSFYNNISDFTLNVGQEQVTRVINKTGVTIPNGSPVIQVGVDGGTGLPSVELAKADTFVNAYVVGLATHDLLNGVPGMLTFSGRVGGLDTSSFAAGDVLYLSGATAGVLTTTPPSIATRVCSVLISDATDGVVLVHLQTNLTLPHLFGMLQGNVTTYSVTTSYQTVTAWTNGKDYGMAINTTNGTIQIPTDSGLYRVTISAACTFTSSASGTRNVTLQVYDEGHAAEVFAYDMSIPKDSDARTASFAFPFEVSAIHNYALRIKGDATVSNFEFTNISFDIEAISLTT